MFFPLCVRDNLILSGALVENMFHHMPGTCAVAEALCRHCCITAKELVLDWAVH